MAKDPICGMFVEEKENSIHHTKEGISYYFCSSQCLNEFLEPEKALKKLKMHVANKHSTNNTNRIASAYHI